MCLFGLFSLFEFLRVLDRCGALSLAPRRRRLERNELCLRLDQGEQALPKPRLGEARGGSAKPEGGGGEGIN